MTLNISETLIPRYDTPAFCAAFRATPCCPDGRWKSKNLLFVSRNGEPPNANAFPMLRAVLSLRSYQLCRSLYDARIITEARQPDDLRLAAKPRHLPLGIVAMSLLGSGDRLLAREFASQELRRLLISQRIYCRCPLRITVVLYQQAGFLDQATLKHFPGSIINARVELLPRGIETHAENTKSSQLIATALSPQ